ncbi:hypothetical protein [Archangium sp.]|uniref:hypothetical protein n=1 Tax=Archangium sp. TaxID=1872627 RepID=UPI003899E34E
MTAQFQDSVLYQGRRFALLKSRGSGLFEPTGHGLSPRAISTACYRGRFCTYAVVEQWLRLSELHIGLEAPLPLAVRYGRGPCLFSKAPALSERLRAK